MPSEPWGPFLFTGGMDVSVAPAVLSPNSAEQLFNFWYDAAGRLGLRPGSTFRARLGEGPVLGLHWHTFETNADPPVVAAVCAEGYAEVFALSDDTTEPAALATAVFAPRVAHGANTIGFSAQADDRFTFASLFDRIYVAGSTTDPYARWYDYATGEFGKLTAFRCRGVLGLRGRALYYGDPQRPNLVYPSLQDDPENVVLANAMQVGGDNAEILRLIETGGLVLALTTRGAYWMDIVNPDEGDYTVDTADPNSGTAGRLAAANADDGYTYWYDALRGPCRWRRGMDAADESFALPLRPLWRRLSPTVPTATVVHYDPRCGGVHFVFATGTAQVPDYACTFFPAAGEGGAWAHWSSTTDLSLVGCEVDGGGSSRYTSSILRLPLAGAGQPLYTAMLSYRDDASRELRTLAADESGHVWILRDGQRDKSRGTASRPGYAFTGLWRSGTFRLAPVGMAKMLHEILLTMEAVDDYSFRWRIERNHSGAFMLTHTKSRDAYPALGAFMLGTSQMATGEPLPVRVTLPVWRNGIANAVRFEVETSSPIALLALDGEVSETARP